ncbi:MAG: S9 family peptidase [Candidatus Krumholzibacteria bacterium]|nr:S9 family peptidase [Candidatus Krumholzibacteria bacterium]
MVTVALAVSPATAVAVEEGKPDSSLSVACWLALGPIRAPLPAFDGESKEPTKAADLLAFAHLPLRDLWPAARSSVRLIGGGKVVWTEKDADTAGVAVAMDAAAAEVAYLAAYVDAPRWMKVVVEAHGTHPFEVFVGGRSVAKSEAGTRGGAPAKGTAKLESGKHLLLVKTAHLPGDTVGEWRVSVTLAPAAESAAVAAVTLDPTRRLRIGEVIEGPMIDDVAIAPDGERFLVTLSRRVPPEGERRRWLEIRRFSDGALERTLADVEGESWRWAPTGRRLSYMVSRDGKGTVRILDLATGGVETIVEDVEHMTGYSWSPDGNTIVYSVNVEPKKDETGVKRLESVRDRRGGERDRSELYLASVPAGVSRRLTAGNESASLHDIHPTGRTLLVGRTREDLTRRPYSRTELVTINLDDQSVDVLCEGPWIGRAMWSPDGRRVLVTGGPSAFGDAGKNVPDGTIPNEYDTQAYLLDPRTKQAEAITRDFDPAIDRVFWPKPGKEIVFAVEEGEYGRLYRYDVGKGAFAPVTLGFDMVLDADVARDRPVAVVSGSSATDRWRLYTVDLRSGRVRMVLDPMAERFAWIEMGDVEPWSFTASSGRTIVGRVYYPPGFDAGKKWPCIVYYYGGTSPVGRDFGGRYPKNLWAAHGYVVYVPQPSGATGFGQAQSARHVNDWGKTTADEVIEGARQFVEAHPFVDPARVGCIGASYGGFLTQLVVTRTDFFAAAVSHAGISSISSYWGEGYWGYLYNAVSAAESFPWNRPDLYVDRSPLFAADKVTTPLLLLHGSSDHNVPPGESEQMYTALKLLGKEVEYIRVEEQDHWVLDYKKRIVWSDAILAWFDKWLKAEGEWWDGMYPPLAKADEESRATDR